MSGMYRGERDTYDAGIGGCESGRLQRIGCIPWQLRA